MYYQKILEHFDIKQATHPSPSSRLAALRQIPQDKILEVLPFLPPFFLTLCIESKESRESIYTAHPITLLRQRGLRSTIKSVLLGTMKDEGKLFTMTLKDAKPSPPEAVISVYPPDLIERITGFYFNHKTAQDGCTPKTWHDVDFARFFSVNWLVGTTHELASVLREKGIEARVYRIDTVLQGIEERLHLGAW